MGRPDQERKPLVETASEENMALQYGSGRVEEGYQSSAIVQDDNEEVPRYNKTEIRFGQ